MKKLEIRARVVILLAALALVAVTVPTKYNQGFSQNDVYAMSEPFSSAPLITYSSI